MIGFNALGYLGRLGNQMFQFAALKGIARNRGFNYCFPPSDLYTRDAPPPYSEPYSTASPPHTSAQSSTVSPPHTPAQSSTVSPLGIPAQSEQLELSPAQTPHSS